MAPAKLGQHFLVNKNVAEKIVRKFFPVQGSILEIGPGTGILTDLLIKYREKKENKIFAVEVDKELYYQIKTKYKENFQIINRSILTVNLENIGNRAKINIISSVPYYISREIIDWVISQHERIEKGLFMTQKEFADKIILESEYHKMVGSTDKCSKGIHKMRNAQSLMFNYLFAVRKLFDVHPGSFSPPPKVKSSVFLFENIEEERKKFEIDNFYLFLKDCFKNRRKTLYNNLVVKYPPEKLREIFEEAGVNPETRAEQLTLKDFLEIKKHLNR